MSASRRGSTSRAASSSSRRPGGCWRASSRRRATSPAPIHIGGNTDPYQPQERRLRVTRGVLETLERFAHPFSIITKSALILRDADIIGPMGRRNLARAAVSVTTLDRALARAMEPRAATPEKRIGAIRGLAEAGCPVTVMFAPVIPGLNDHELEAVLEARPRPARARATWCCACPGDQGPVPRMAGAAGPTAPPA